MFALFTKTILRKNIFNYILLAVVYILLFVCTMSMLSFKNQVDTAITNIVATNSFNHHLRLRGDENAKYFVMSDLDSLGNENVDYVTEILSVEGTLENESKLSIIGINYGKLSNMGITIIKGLDNFKDSETENLILLGQAMATQLNLNIEDELYVFDSQDVKHTFIVSGICRDSLWFVQNPTSIIVDLETAQSFPDMNSKLMAAFIRLKNVNLIDVEYLRIGELLKTKNITIDKIYDTTKSDYYIAPVNLVLKLFSGLAMALSFFLLFYTYKRIIDNRTSAYGTMISLGISKSKIWALLFIEILIFVLTISIIGAGLSVFVTSALIRNVIGMTLLSFNALNAVMLFLAFLVITYFVSILIVRSVFKKGPVKILKGQLENNIAAGQTSNKIVFWTIAGLGLLSFICGIIFRYISSNLMSTIGLTLLLSGAVILSFYLVYIIGYVGKMVSENKFPKLSSVFTKCITNIFKTKGYICIVFMLTILIALTSTAEATITKSMNNYFTNTDLVVILKGDFFEREDFNSFNNVKNVYKTQTVKILVDQQNITFTGINTTEFGSFAQDSFADIKQTMNKLASHDNGILMSKTLLKAKDLKVGSSIIIPTVKGKISFKIIDSFETMDNLGLNVYVSTEVFNSYFIAESTQYYVEAEELSVDNLIKEISNSEKFGSNISIAKTTDIMRSALLNITTIIMTIKLFLVVLFLISVICCSINVYLNVVSNLRASCIESSLGKTRLRIVLETLCEHVILIGLITIIFASIVAAFASYYIMDILEYTVGSFKYSFTLSVTSIIYMLLIVMGSLIFPVITYLKKNTVKILKEEF
ncbi:MAG: hypothetical protein LBF12_07435 [Christensenellaceae bacterium]|jgi:ABC-type lipoprotein release transport system permease subunit|nr:hypothetical protein [Christensenellaceae bacterium]